MVGDSNEVWDQVVIPNLKKEGINVELVKFSDYIQPNEALAKAGLELVVLPSSELSRGRGGPRCMSMPFVRDAL